MPSLTSEKRSHEASVIEMHKRRTRFGNRIDGRLCCTRFSELCAHVRLGEICAADGIASSANSSVEKNAPVALATLHTTAAAAACWQREKGAPEAKEWE